MIKVVPFRLDQMVQRSLVSSPSYPIGTMGMDYEKIPWNDEPERPPGIRFLGLVTARLVSY